MTSLGGLRVWLTRPRPEAERSARAWRGAGATVRVEPLVEIRPRTPSTTERREVEEFGATRLLLTSANAAAHFAREFGTQPGLKAAAVGEKTAARARELGFEVDFVASRATGEDLARELLAGGRDRRFLMPAGSRPRPELPRMLREAGSQLKILTLYETVLRRPDPSAAPAADDVDLVACYSPSAVEALDQWDGQRSFTHVAALGRTTGAAVRECARELVACPEKPGEQALLEEVARWWKERT
jgi:uroporphyrinogen-III synthase